jgi:hypothetical protein
MKDIIRGAMGGPRGIERVEQTRTSATLKLFLNIKYFLR